MKLHELIKDKLKETLQKYCTSGVPSASVARSVTRQNKILNLSEEGARLLYEATDEIMHQRKSISENFTRRFIEDRLLDVLFSFYFTPPTNLDAALVRSVKSLLRRWQRTKEEWIFFVPIIYLNFPDIKRISLGGVLFYKIRRVTLRYLELKHKSKFVLGSSLEERYSNLTKRGATVLAIVKASAGERRKAQEKALFATDSALDVFRLYEPLRGMGIQGEVLTTTELRDVYYINLRTRVAGGEFSRTDADLFFPFVLDRSKLSLLRRKGHYQEFDRILKEKVPTKLERKLLTALHWYGLSIRDKDDRDKFVKLIIALESILLRGNEKLKKHYLSERAAFLLGIDKDSRKQIYDGVGKLYNVRNHIVHEGRMDVDEADVAYLIHLLRSLILFVVRYSRKLASLDDVDRGIEEIKFGSKKHSIV